MSILFLILKIIGISILSIICLVVILLILLLFCPYMYKIKGSYLENDKPYFKAVLNWLFSFISLTVLYDEKLTVRFRVLFFTIYSNNKKNIGVKQEKTAAGKEADKVPEGKNRASTGLNDAEMDADDLYDTETADDYISENDYKILSCDDISNEIVIADYYSGDDSDNKLDDNANDDEDSLYYEGAESVYYEYSESVNEGYVTDNPVNVNNDDTVNEPESLATESAEKPKKGKSRISKMYRQFKRDMRSLGSKIKEEVQLIADTVKGIKDKTEKGIEATNNKIEKLKSDYNNFNKIINDERNVKYVKLVFAEVKRLIKGILPRKVDGFVHFGFENPSTTGRMCGYIATVRGYINKGLRINPDFTRPVFETDVLLKGRIYLFVLIEIAIKIYFNKDRKRLLQMLENNRDKA